MDSVIVTTETANGLDIQLHNESVAKVLGINTINAAE
jgi:hypothetical protein